MTESRRFPEALLDDIRARVSLAALIGREVALTRRGREHEGLCPFHSERTPSFHVAEEKGFFHCFGCGAHGDAFGWLMRAGRLSFVEAVEALAAETGVEVPRFDPEAREAETRRAGLMEALEAAAVFFEAELRKQDGSAGLDYLRGRGVGDETISRFRLGWAPARDGLRRALAGARFPESLLLEAGLLRRREDGSVGDLFRERVIFPITDRRGRVVAFGGRLLEAKAGAPKYLNSPASPVFDKGATLYGIAHAREGAGRAGRVVAVEGYMDVIALHQADLPFAVAPLGTALTERHLAELWRMAPEPVVCLDGDRAGRNAMRKTADRALPLLEPGRTLRFAVLPDGHDPDSLAREGGAEAVRAVLDASRTLSVVVWDALEAEFPPDIPERLAAFDRALMAAAARIPDAGVRRAVLGEFRRRLRESFAFYAPVALGRSASKIAPEPRAVWLREEWDAAREAAESGPVRGWLERHGIAWDALARTVGGVGFARGKPARGKVERLEDGAIGPVALWEHDPKGIGLVVLPAWEGPPGDGVPLDLIGWDPRGEVLYSRTGQTLVLGESVIEEAMVFEGRGLYRRVAVAAAPMSWLRRTASGEEPVLVVDWRRAWSALGGLSGLVAESVELAAMLDKHVRPPPLPRPAILVAEEVAA